MTNDADFHFVCEFFSISETVLSGNHIEPMQSLFLWLNYAEPVQILGKNLRGSWESKMLTWQSRRAWEPTALHSSPFRAACRDTAHLGCRPIPPRSDRTLL